MTLLLLLAILAPDRASPFTDALIEGDTPRVRYEGTWYELVSIEGIDGGDLIAFCRKTYGAKSEKRFAEDLVDVLRAMGKPPGDTVSLALRKADTGKVTRVAKAAMTKENRQAVRHARQQRRNTLTPDRARDDLVFLKRFLEGHHSYRFHRPEGLAALDGDPGATREDVARFVARAFAKFGDGHTRVRGRWDWLPKGYAPFVVRDCGDRFAALDDGNNLLDPKHPYLAAIDGVPVAKWIDATGAWIAHGSPAFRRWSGAEEIVFLAALREELKLPAKETVELELSNADGGTVTRSLEVLAQFPRRRHRQLGETRMLDGNLGYLRIEEMDDGAAFLAGLLAAMERFAKTDGLVIDVRDNGGGSRHALRTLLPFVIKVPRVVNVARLRQDGGGAADDLADRFLHPADWSGWSKESRAAIESFQATFKPEWIPPDDAFSDWHYMVVEPGKLRYAKPVVVLLNGGCFSATDIFLGAFRGLDGVTLIGTPSGGGSGRSRRLDLPKTGVRIRVSTMASFRPNGQLYDGRGIEPDLLVPARPSDWTGRTDTQLEAAVKHLTKR